jgi:channel protein (hemolysin III family)
MRLRRSIMAQRVKPRPFFRNLTTCPMLVLPMSGEYVLLLGGLFYTNGVVFYLLDGKFSYFHGIWHIFVLLGSFSHYFAILYFVT